VVAVIRTLRRTRIAVPERISVLGFDDQPLADWFDLSTVAQSASDIGREAGELALRLIEDSQAEHEQHVILPTYVIPRPLRHRRLASRTRRRAVGWGSRGWDGSWDGSKGARGSVELDETAQEATSARRLTTASASDCRRCRHCR
jgi:hypothetical protein